MRRRRDPRGDTCASSRAIQRRASNQRMFAFSGKRKRSKPSQTTSNSSRSADDARERGVVPSVREEKQELGLHRAVTGNVGCSASQRARSAGSSTSHNTGSAAQRMPARPKPAAVSVERVRRAPADRRERQRPARADEDVAAVFGRAQHRIMTGEQRDRVREAIGVEQRAIGADEQHRVGAGQRIGDRMRHACAQVAADLRVQRGAGRRGEAAEIGRIGGRRAPQLDPVHHAGAGVPPPHAQASAP